MMRHVDLCSGIGGFALGFEWAGLSRPVMFCDIEPWSRKILAKHWPDVPIEEDVKVLANEPEKIPAGGRDTILTAGYPCQPFSHAGMRKGEEDDRHIWPYIREIVAQKRPAWCVFENVYGHVSMGLDTVLSNLEADGFASRCFIVPACGVDAPHRRDRVWIIAHANSNGQPNRAKHEQRMAEDVADTSCGRYRDEEKEICTRRDTVVSGSATTANVAYTDSFTERKQGDRPDRKSVNSSAAGKWSAARHRPADTGWWPTEPSVGRVANGIPGRVDRIRGLGNAIVPQIAMQIGLTIKKIQEAKDD